MNKDEFQTVSKQGEALYKEKGSKFYGFAFHAESLEEVKKHLTHLKSKFHNARHICYAYRIDPINLKERANDDGEPANAAGTPILNQIYSAELHNTLVAVVRYFGGVKLGVPGMIRSYKTAAKEAIENAQVSKELITQKMRITVDYSLVNKLMRIVKSERLNVVSQESNEKMSLTIAVRLTEVERVTKMFVQENQFIFETID